jgi:hypothetical protein
VLRSQRKDIAMKLPEPIAAYYAAKNRKDVDGMLAVFASGASVRDEGKTHQGRADIRAWMEDTTRRYGVKVEVLMCEEAAGWVVVGAKVSGNFPGSPAGLTYRFQVSDAAITALEIG